MQKLNCYSCIALLCLTVTFLSACDLAGTNKKPDLKPVALTLPQGAPEIITSVNNFGIDLFVKVAAGAEENLMLSPLSANIALSMLLNGANGQTRSQIQEMLGYSLDKPLVEINESYHMLVQQLLNADKQVNIHVANAAFMREGFPVKQDFINTLRTRYAAEARNLDFASPAALQTINKWASDNTNGRIDKVLEEISPQAVMFLMNALYFKGDWSTAFQKNSTTNLPFIFSDGSTAEVPTMMGNVRANTYQTSDFMAVELPYGRRNYSMVIVLPSESLSGFYTNFNSDTWHEITSALGHNDEWSNMDVRMPKFTFKTEEYLNKPLRELGMVDAFDARAADLSGINENWPLVVSFVKQDTFVDVNESGTEAAAVTTIAIERTSAGPPAIHINKPFIFAIRERTTNTLLFVGHVLDPR